MVSCFGWISIKIYVLAQALSALSGSSWADTPSYCNVLYPHGGVQLLETHGHSTRQKTRSTSFEEYELQSRAVERHFVAIFER